MTFLPIHFPGVTVRPALWRATVPASFGRFAAQVKDAASGGHRRQMQSGFPAGGSCG